MNTLEIECFFFTIFVEYNKKIKTMSKFISIPISTEINSSFTLDAELVIKGKQSEAIASGSSDSIGATLTASNTATGVGYPDSGAGVATVATSGTGTGLTVTYTQTAGVVDVNSVVVVTGGINYLVGDTFSIAGGDTNAVGAILTVQTVVNRLTDSSKDFVALGVAAGDFCFDTTTNTTRIIVSVAATFLTLDGTFPGGNNYFIKKPLVVRSSTADFSTHQVQVGDIVRNISDNLFANVAEVLSNTEILLDADIFNTAQRSNANFTISAKAQELYNFDQQWTSNVKVGDFIVFSSGVVSKVEALVGTFYRVKLFKNVTIDDTFKIYDSSLSSPLLVAADHITVATIDSTTSVKLFCSTDYTITLTTSSDVDKTVLTGIQNAQIAAEGNVSGTAISFVQITPSDVVITGSAVG
tara:strand:+ start:13043 stop:14278 length:1236 start_codon:yes stop_codon:yes gene_type:complete